MEINKSEVTFEENINTLENIVKKLESSDISLEEMLTLFEEGIRTTKECATQLRNAEQKITMLVKDENGEIFEKTFAAK